MADFEVWLGKVILIVGIADQEAIWMAVSVTHLFRGSEFLQRRNGGLVFRFVCLSAESDRPLLKQSQPSKGGHSSFDCFSA